VSTTYNLVIGSGASGLALTDTLAARAASSVPDRSRSASAGSFERRLWGDALPI
jgi:hypothetical protein